MEFEWDEHKNQQNIRKHHIRFETAIEVFGDRRQLSRPARVVDGEQRTQTIGRIGPVVVSVIHTARIGAAGELTVRLISARRASRRERAVYDQ